VKGSKLFRLASVTDNISVHYRG